MTKTVKNGFVYSLAAIIGIAIILYFAGIQKIFFILSSAFIVLLLALISPIVIPGKIELDPDAESSKNLYIISYGEWHITDSLDWIEIHPDSGKNLSTVKVSVNEDNQSLQSRAAFVDLLFEGGSSKSIDISQLGAISRFNASPEELILDYKSDLSGTVKIKSNTSWYISEKPGWISVNKSKGDKDENIIVKARLEEKQYEARQGYIKVRTIDKQREIIINVKLVGQLFITVDETAVQLNPTETQSVVIGLKSNTRWEIAGVPEDLIVQPVKESGDQNVTISLKNQNIKPGNYTFRIVSKENDAIFTSVLVNVLDVKRFGFKDLNNYIESNRGKGYYDSDIFEYIDPECKVYYIINEEKLTYQTIQEFLNKTIVFGGVDSVVENSIIYGSDGRIIEFGQK